MDTPGAEDGCEGLGGLGGHRYHLRLSTHHVRLKAIANDSFTHAVQQPSSPMDQMVPYHIIPAVARPTCRM